MDERYNLEGSERQTDEFMKPIILNTEGLIRGILARMIGCIKQHMHIYMYNVPIM